MADVDDGEKAPLADDGEKEFLVLCPRCSYALCGLPAQHICPECGLEFDRRWRVFGRAAAAKNSKWMLRFIIGCILTLLVLGFDLVPLTVGLVPAGLRPGILMLVIGLAALTVAAALRQQPAFVAVGPAGVHIYRGPRRIEHYAWPEIGRGRMAWSNRSLILPATGKDVTLSFMRFFAGAGGGMAEAERLLRYVNHYPRAAAAPPSG